MSDGKEVVWSEFVPEEHLLRPETEACKGVTLSKEQSKRKFTQKVE